MDEKLFDFHWQVWNPNDGAAVGASAIFFKMPLTATLVEVSVSPFADDAGATMDIQVDTVDVVTAIDASDHDVPGIWKTTDTSGTNDPIQIAAGSSMELDFNSAQNGNRFDVTLWFKSGAGWG
jgi:hypothetical protein